MPIDIPDTVVVALVAAAAALFGHFTTRQTSKEQTTITVMQSQISQLWERVQAQEKRIDELVAERTRERARSWAAIEYARTLIAHVEALCLLLPRDIDPPPLPPAPDALSADL